MPSATPAEWKGPSSNSTFMGHPAGLFVLFFTEMLERFSYYGARGLLKLYMVNYLFITVRQTLQGKAYDGTGNPDDVIGWSFIRPLLPTIEPEALQQCIGEKVTSLLTFNEGMTADLAQTIATQKCSVEPAASMLYGVYTSLVYLTPVIGGWMADRYLGQKKSVYVGAIAMALGQLVLFGADNLFFIGLLLLIIGNGFFKPSIATQVGSLYPPGDDRRDGGFTLFYMGITFGAFICNFVCGTLAAVFGWRYGFLAAGIGMCIGLLVQFLGRNYLAPDTLQEHKTGGAQAVEKQPLTANEWKQVWALVALCLLNAVFWAIYSQHDLTMRLWADTMSSESPWTSGASLLYGSVLFIFIFAPILALFWAWQHKRGTEPSSVAKMAMGFFIISASFIVMVLGARLVSDGIGGLLWPMVCTLLLTMAELYLAPVGMSLVTKVAPVRIVSLMMGVWFLSSFVGNFLSGFIGRFSMRMSMESSSLLFLMLGIASGAAVWLFNKPLLKLPVRASSPGPDHA
jgi:POT family proton-dependent oligopeptide transporter